MISIAFFTSIFLTFGWLIFCLIYISEKLHGVSLSMLGSIDLLVYNLITFLPVLIIWMIFSHTNNYINNRANNKKMKNLLEQMKRNQDYSDLMARVLIESEQTIKSGFIINKFDIFISEINELIAEILKHSGSTNEQIQDAWFRVNNGEKWFLGRLFIEKTEDEPNFIKDLAQMVRFDNLLAATISRFYIDYKNILSILEKHDKENIFQNMIEAGVLGKIFTLLAPISNKIEIKEEIKAVIVEPKIEFKSEAPKEIKIKEKDEFEEEIQKSVKDKKPNWLSRLPNIPNILSKRKSEKTDYEQDLPSIVNRDSFYMFLDSNKSDKKETAFSRKEPMLRRDFDEDDEG